MVAGQFHVNGSPLAEVPDLGADKIRRMVEDRGITETIEYLGGLLAPKCDPRETLRLKQLTLLALESERVSSPRLRDFVRLVREKRIERPQAAPVRVMTIHQSKGLEFDAVILAELDGPLTRQSGNCVADVRDLGHPPRAITRYVNQQVLAFSFARLAAGVWRASGRCNDRGPVLALCVDDACPPITSLRDSSECQGESFENRTPASLIYHALGCQQDPTQGGVTLFESGDPDWMAEASRVIHRRSSPSRRLCHRVSTVTLKAATQSRERGLVTCL